MAQPLSYTPSTKRCEARALAWGGSRLKTRLRRFVIPLGVESAMEDGAARQGLSRRGASHTPARAS
jgi:hypothetical protein